MYLGMDYSLLTMGLVYRDAQDPKVSLCCIIWNKAVLVLSNDHAKVLQDISECSQWLCC